MHHEPFEQAIADELDKVGAEIRCARYRHESNDEYTWRLIAHLEDSIDSLENEIARLDGLYHTVKALL